MLLDVINYVFSHHLGWSLPTPANRLAMIWLAEQAKCGTAQARGPHVLLTTAHLRDRWQAWRQQVQSILECQLIADEPKTLFWQPCASDVCGFKWYARPCKRKWLANSCETCESFQGVRAHAHVPLFYRPAAYMFLVIRRLSYTQYRRTAYRPDIVVAQGVSEHLKIDAISTLFYDSEH